MTNLDQAIAQAFKSEGKQEDVNKVYLTLLRSMLFLPVKKGAAESSEEPFSPLYAEVSGNYFMMVFDTLDRLKNWAAEEWDAMNYVEISGHDVILGIHEKVFLCLNYGTEFYKEFSPDEVKRLKTIVARIEEMKKASAKS